MTEIASRGSRLRFLTFRLVSPVPSTILPSRTPIHTGVLFGEPSGISVDRCAKLGRDNTARALGSIDMGRSSPKLYARIFSAVLSSQVLRYHESFAKGLLPMKRVAVLIALSSL